MLLLVKNSFQEVIRSRQSIRQFLPTPVEEEVLREVLEDAQYTPSNCNTQPWDVHIVSGAKKEELSKAMIDTFKKGNPHLTLHLISMTIMVVILNDKKNKVKHIMKQWA